MQDPRLECVRACLDLKNGEDENDNIKVWSKYFKDIGDRWQQQNPGKYHYCGDKEGDSEKPVHILAYPHKIDGHYYLEFCVSGKYIDTEISNQFIREKFPDIPIFYEAGVPDMIKYIENLPRPPKTPSKSYCDAEFDYQYQQYKEDGWIRSNLISYCIARKNSRDPKIQDVLTAYNATQELVSNVQCQNPDNPFEKETAVKKYLFIRQDYLGRHVISITRPKIDCFYLTVGVQYRGNFWKDENGVERFGYYLVGTNGDHQDVKEAVETTQHLW